MSNEIVYPVGTKVKRIKDGNTGEVIEDNEEFRTSVINKGGTPENSRRRIKWDHNKPRTWIALTDLVKIA